MNADGQNAVRHVFNFREPIEFKEFCENVYRAYRYLAAETMVREPVFVIPCTQDSITAIWSGALAHYKALYPGAEEQMMEQTSETVFIIHLMFPAGIKLVLIKLS